MIPIQQWNPQSRIELSKVLEFGTPGFAFMHRSHTTASKKLLPRSIYVHFVGMGKDTRLYRVYIPHLRKVLLVRRDDFKIMQNNPL